MPEQHRFDPDVVAQLFESFGQREAPTVGSPLYATLCLGIAGDRELVALAAQARSMPVPNVFLGAVHYLLLQGAEHPLRDFYPTCGGTGSDHADPVPHFRDFVLGRREAITALIESRLTQTNEVRRCACLVPGFVDIARRSKRPLALIEVGASAGLNLLWDRYAYDYGTGAVWGDPDSPVQLQCEWRAQVPPRLPEEQPAVISRVGADLNPIDVMDDDAVLWLRALIWPEHTERMALLDRALEIARGDPPRLVAGDALDQLPGLLAEAPPDATLCVFHSFTVVQFGDLARRRFEDILRDHAQSRPIYRLGLEHEDFEIATLRLRIYDGDARSSERLATCQPHGRWILWAT